MIRNYQRSGGGGSVDLGPIYSSINALQNEINSLITVTDFSSLSSLMADINVISTRLTTYISYNDERYRSLSQGIDISLNSIYTRFTSHTMGAMSSFSSLSSSLTQLSTAFTSYTSISDYRWRTYTAAVASSFADISSGGGDITLTNPTMNSHVYTDPVLYSGPNIGSEGYDTTPDANTYMKGVTWIDMPDTTAPSGYSTKIAALKNCSVYGDLSFSNVTSVVLSNVTATNAIIKSCYNYTIVGGTYNEISVKRGLGHVSSVSAFSFKSPDCVWCVFERCNMHEMSIYYPSWVSSYVNEFRLYLNSNTINKINASVIKFDATGNDIWTANFYLDYDLMQTSSSRSIPGYFFSNTIHELSIFNHDHGDRNTTNIAIPKNGVYLHGNSINSCWYDLYCGFSVYNNTIETLDNMVGVGMVATNNSVQEWSCTVSPFSALLQGTSTTQNVIQMTLNDIGYLDILYGIGNETIEPSSVSHLYIAASKNTISNATLDVPHPVSLAEVSAKYISHNGHITFSSCDIGKMDWLDGNTSPAIVQNCTINDICITGTGTEPPNDNNALRFSSNSIDYMNMLVPNGCAKMIANTMGYNTLNVYSYIDNGGGAIKQLDITAANAALKYDMTAGLVNVYCTKRFYCGGVVFGLLNVSFSIEDIDTDNSYPFILESASIDRAVCIGNNDIGGIVNWQDFKVNGCTFNSISFDFNIAALSRNSITGIADIKMDTGYLYGNTCNGILNAVVSDLNMSSNSLTLGEVYYSVSNGSVNTITYCGHMR